MARIQGQQWIVRRRRRGRSRPKRRIGVALHAGTGAGIPAEAFPGLHTHTPGPTTHLVSGAISLLVHGGAIALLLLLAWLAPPELVEEILPVELIQPGEPAPAPRVIAESSGAFAPAAQAVMPQIVNPKVVTRAAPSIGAQALELASVESVSAPTQVQRRVVEAERVRAVRSVAGTTSAPVAVAPVAPALRGPLEVKAPVGPSVGPRAVTSGGDTVGLGAPGALGTGSSVREGIASDRDVAGSVSGPRLASVNTRIGDSLWGAGPGGAGTGLGGVSFEECTARPEVQAYMEQVRQRMYSRWVVPPAARPNQEITLRFKLDPAGSASKVRLLAADDAPLGESAVQALRSASPFPPMPERVRCLARDGLVAKFRNPTGAS